MPRPAAATDTWTAVADPTRRAILDRLRRGPAPVHDLAAGFDISRPAVSRHLRVLREANLVVERRDGRENVYALTPAPLAEMARWVDEYRQFWQVNLQSLKRHLEKKVGEEET